MNQRNSEDDTRSFIPRTKGTVISHYKIVEKIGAGGMGEVYLAEDTKLNRRVALKFMPSHLTSDDSLRTRFTREAQAAAKLDHPNIVTIYEVGEFQNQPFIAMQYVEGKTLHHYCQEETLSIPQIIEIVSQVSAGLSKAHAAGVIHRDIKASNIIVDRELRPKILDFGLAAIQGSEMLTRAGSTLGTVAYMSPEQAQGREVDHRSDLFSLGIVLYELITGRTPFKRNNEAATLQALIYESPEPLARYKSDIAPDLQRVLDRILAKDTSERYQSAADFAADLRAIIRSTDSVGTGTAGRVAVGRPSIAVLPFANMSADPENEYFSDGLTEELLNVLAKNPELKVTGRTSSFAFKGKQEDLRVIGQKLGVGALLEGSVRKAGNRVRITAQLVSAADGFHLWSETYDRVLDDIFAVQDEIAGAVSTAMHVTLIGVSEKKRTVDPESYSLALRARQSYQQMNEESLSLAVELYSRAIEIDPQHAQAWAELSLTYAIRVAYGHAEHSDEYPLARQAAEKALAIDEQSPAAHNAMAWVFTALELQIQKGTFHIRRAYELAPNDSAILSFMATWEMILGDFDRAVRLSRKSIELDPLNPFTYRELGRILMFAGHLDEAIDMYNKVLNISPDMTSVHLGLSTAEVLRGNFEEALRKIEKEKLAGYRFCGQAIASYALGRQSDFDRQLAALIAEGENWSFQIATVYAFQGDSDKAFEWLERAHKIHDSGVPLTKVHPFLKSLHADPRWPMFLKKIGLAD
jgi:serine/threonine protein kinase/Tfp pilus assembly protein PilF